MRGGEDHLLAALTQAREVSYRFAEAGVSTPEGEGFAYVVPTAWLSREEEIATARAEAADMMAKINALSGEERAAIPGDLIAQIQKASQTGNLKGVNVGAIDKAIEGARDTVRLKAEQELHVQREAEEAREHVHNMIDKMFSSDEDKKWAHAQADKVINASTDEEAAKEAEKLKAGATAKTGDKDAAQKLVDATLEARRARIEKENAFAMLPTASQSEGVSSAIPAHDKAGSNAMSKVTDGSSFASLLGDMSAEGLAQGLVDDKKSEQGAHLSNANAGHISPNMLVKQDDKEKSKIVTRG